MRSAILLMIVGAIAAQGASPDDKFNLNSYPSINSWNNGGLTIKWKVIENGSKVQFYIKRTGAGWIGFGIGNGMADSDWVLIRRDSADNWKPILKDCSHMNSNTSCKESEENWMLARPDSYTSSENSIELEVVRAAKGSGKDNDKDIMNGIRQWTWALGSDQMVNDEKPSTGHGATSSDRGKFNIAMALNGSIFQAGFAVVLLAFFAMLM